MKQKEQKTKNNRFNASSCKKHPISWEHLQKDTAFLLYICYLKFYKKCYFPWESHLIWYFNWIHTTTLSIKLITSFSSKNYVLNVKMHWTCICLLVPLNWCTTLYAKVSDLQQVSGFLWVFCFPPPIKLAATI